MTRLIHRSTNIKYVNGWESYGCQTQTNETATGGFRPGTVVASVVCLVRAGARAVAHVVVHQALVDGAPRCATVVRTNERIPDHPGSQAALAEVLVQSRVTAPTVGTCIRTHRKGRKRCQSHSALLTAVKLFISAASWTITVIIIQIAPGYPAASVGTLEVWCPRYHLLIGQPGGFEHRPDFWKKVYRSCGLVVSQTKSESEKGVCTEDTEKGPFTLRIC